MVAAGSQADADLRSRASATSTLAIAGIEDLVVDGTSDVGVHCSVCRIATQYPHLAGLQPDLYRCFMEQTWRHQSAAGVDRR